MMVRIFGMAALAGAGLACSVAAVDAWAQTARPPATQKRPAETSFQKEVLPVFDRYCIACHQPGGPGFEKSGLDLRTYEGVMKGTKFGPMVVPKDLDSSNLLVLLDHRASPELRMPHNGARLSEADRNKIRRWILEGARNN
jgi:hypothetical protein